MRRAAAVFVTGAVVVAGGVAFAPAAQADERTCRGTIGARTVDNLRVPQGAKCVLRGTVVKGTITVARNATLDASKVRVVGNVQAENHRHVRLVSSRVGGSVQLKQGRTSRLVSNRVTGDIQLFTNRGTQTVSMNRVNGNLQCKANRPAPKGSGNVVGGNKEDQCRRL